jgi:glucose/arabinose dehydrogenase
VARREGSLKGTVLRFDLGRASEDPLRDASLYAEGFRNVQGLDWDPVSSQLYAIDHGPTGMPQEDYRTDQDELNRVRASAHHGWPEVVGMWRGGGYTAPVVEWTPAIAPAGLAFVDDPGSSWYGDVLVTGLRGRQLQRVVLEPDTSQDSLPPRAVCAHGVLDTDLGRLRAVRVHGGSVYFTTSNRDQRGSPGPKDDLLLRFSLPGTQPEVSADPSR